MPVPPRSPSTFGHQRTVFDRSRTKVGLGAANVALGAALVALVALAACSSSGPDVEPPQPGDALEAAARGGDPLTLPPGQEVIVVARALRNTSGGELEITKLRAMPGDGVPEAVQVVQVSVLASSPAIPPGTYVTFPPVTRPEGRCERAGILSPSGVVMEGHDAPVVMVWLRAIGEGAATIDGFRVTYRQSGTLFEQEVEVGLADITVDATAEARKPSREEQACDHRTRVLPGAVVF